MIIESYTGLKYILILTIFVIPLFIETDNEKSISNEIINKQQEIIDNQKIISDSLEKKVDTLARSSYKLLIDYKSDCKKIKNIITLE